MMRILLVRTVERKTVCTWESKGCITWTKEVKKKSHRDKNINHENNYLKGTWHYLPYFSTINWKPANQNNNTPGSAQAKRKIYNDNFLKIPHIIFFLLYMYYIEGITKLKEPAAKTFYRCFLWEMSARNHFLCHLKRLLQWERENI